jgi:hypothetical protein
VSGLTYDAGALVAADRNDPRMWSIHRELLERGHLPTVPAPVLAQVWRSGRQARLAQLLAGCEVEVLDEPRARDVGVACARTSTPDIVDVGVVLGALVRGDSCVTSDPDDLSRIAGALGTHLALLAV